MTLALTFDDGPSPLYTPRVLAVLRRHGVRATFFVLGVNVEKYPDVVRQIVAEGHTLGNHTWSHPKLEKLSTTAVRRQITRTNEAVARVHGGRGPSLFRAPYGHFTPAALTSCADLAMRPFRWSIDPRDWSNPGAAHISATVLDQARTGAVVLHHDGVLSRHTYPEYEGRANRTQTIEALKAYLPRLLDRGFRFTTLDA
ncbi:polysaccharide deacetylase family protein [Streptomyces sp. NPDC047525]|uniref:polysaccharide deacetylase family protein n=1 Tax=Streptomyces sp. NPDC047525 TaxID=3155264 RepID=UPI0033E8CAF9